MLAANGAARDADRRNECGGPGGAVRRSAAPAARTTRRAPAFANLLLDEATTLFLSGEPQTARLALRDLVNATVGFERPAAATGKPAKSLHRMLSTKGNPSMDNLAAIFDVARKRLGVELEARTVRAA
jgi:DNA-binding phage protein